MTQLELTKYEKIFTPNKIKFKCKYCFVIMTNPNDMIKHESECHLNPINKKCETCQRYYHYSVCNRMNEGLDCSRWTNILFERMEKLKKIKNKLL